jgi:hypothetical protein
MATSGQATISAFGLYRVAGTINQHYLIREQAEAV